MSEPPAVAGGFQVKSKKAKGKNESRFRNFYFLLLPFHLAQITRPLPQTVLTCMKKFKTILAVLLCFVCFQTAQADWVKQNLNTLAWLHDVYFLNEKSGWIAGSNGTLFATADGGKTWKKEDTKIEDTIVQVYFTDEFTGWLLCERNFFDLKSNPSYLMKTTDGGINWEKQEFETLRREHFIKLFFNSQKIGFVVGASGAFYTLRDGEEKWKQQFLPTIYKLLDGTFADVKNGVIIGGGGSIFFTEDAGITWKASNVFKAPSTRFNAVFFVDKKNGWTVGTEGKIFQTGNGGKTWREQPSGVNANLNDIVFTSSAKGWAIGDEGTVLFTNSAGSKWILKESKIKHKFEKIFFNGKKGWIVGFGGTVLVYDSETSQIQKPT